MKRFTLILLLFVFNNCIAQDKETQAQAYYMAADMAYNNGNYEKAYDKLQETEKTLGSSNAKISYLKAKTLMELKQYSRAKEEMSRYFDLAKDKKGTEKYNEIMLLYAQVDDINNETTATAKYEGRITTYVSHIESVYKKSYWFMQKEKRMSDSKIEPVTYENGEIVCTYSGTFATNSTLKNIEPEKIEDIFVMKDHTWAPYSVIVKYKDAPDQKKHLWI